MPSPVGIVASAVVPASGGAWSPLDLPNVYGHWDASDLTTLTTSAGKVSQLRDKTAGARHFTQATGTKQPTTGTTINGLNTLGFAGAQSLRASTVSHAQPMTYYVVAKYATTVNGALFDGTGSSRNSLATNASSLWDLYSGNVEVTTGGAAVAATTYQLVAVFNIANCELYVNGTKVMGPVGPGVWPIGDMWLGTTFDVSNWLNGQIGEITAQASVPSAGDLASWNTYTATKWGTPTPGWSPASLPGLAAWYDTSDAATITATAGAVSQWNDKSGNVRHLTQATGTAQPITGTRTINARNVLDFDGTDDVLASATFTLAQPLTAFVVALSDGGSNSVNETVLDQNSTTQTRINKNSSNGWNMNFGAGLAGGIPAPDTAAHVHGVVLDGAGGTTSTRYLDGAVVATGNAGGNPISAGLRVGLAGNALQGWNGTVGEVIYYAGALSTTDRQAVESYLRTKWGTP